MGKANEPSKVENSTTRVTAVSVVDVGWRK
jgi:hypothetical protein